MAQAGQNDREGQAHPRVPSRQGLQEELMTSEEAYDHMSYGVETLTEGALFGCRETLECHTSYLIQHGAIDELAKALNALETLNIEIERRDDDGD